jgi:hypothetical protein
MLHPNERQPFHGSCPACGGETFLPDGELDGMAKKQLQVTCVRCWARWRWTPSERTAERVS